MMGIPIAVLIVEDSESDALLVARLLKKGRYDVTFERIDNAEQMRTALEKQPWDIVISDYSLPHFNGFAALHLLQETGRDIPFIIVSGAIGEENAAGLMKAGVHDYLMKHNLTRLVPVVERELAQAEIRRERVRTEKALEESKERYQTLAQVSPVGIFHTNANGSTTYVNPEWCHISGLPPDDALGDGWLSVVHPEDRDVLRSGWLRAMADGKVSSSEYRFLHPDGSIAWVLGQAVPLRNAEGQATGYIGTITDITERKHMEEALRESEEKYRLLVEHSGTGVALYNSAGTLLFANSTAARVLGGKPEDFVGKNLADLLGKTGAEQYMRRIRIVLTNQYPEEYEDHVILPGGTKWFLSSYARVVDMSGAVIGVQIVSHNITERKQAEIALRMSETENRMLYETMRDGFVHVDMQGRILMCNNAYCELLGYSKKEMTRLSYQDVTPANWIEVDATMIREQIVPRGYSDVYEKEYRSKDGALVPIELRAVLIRDEAGIPVGMWAVVRDITERKRADQALRESQRSTETILNSLTSHIAVIDEAGTIVSVNIAWTRFAAEEGCSEPADVGVGANYFDVCTKAIENSGDEIARKALKGIADVISHASASFYQEYPCDSPDKKRWFSMRVSPVLGARSGVVIAHENITERKITEMQIRDLAGQLRRFSIRQESAREEERTHIAREIHDELGQALTALKMDLSDISRSDTQLPERVRNRLSVMGKLIDQTTVAVQRLAGELRPPMLDELGLIAAVSWYIQDFEERSGIACTRVRFDDEPSPHRARATALYRILQESLTNVARHSNATEVEIRLEFAGGSALLEVKDNGKGITNEEMKNLDSIGILGMRERMQGFGGSLEIHGIQGSGTTVRATMPWPIS